ncbi:MAG: carbohydrate ABC transporter permease [Bacilli bacterium]|nr:carbohydrate ABC transporter permease [Bacilli bacterium]
MKKLNLKFLKREKKMKGKSGKRLNRSLYGDIILFTFLFIFGLFSAWPMIFVINNAFKPLNEILLFPPKLFVKNPTFDNFRDMFVLMNNSWVPFSRYLFNTLFITIVGTVGSVFISSLAAFPLAKYNFPGSKLMSKMIVYSLMFSSAVTGIPSYIIISRLQMLDTFWAILIPTFGTTLGLYLMQNFMSQIPTDLIESAKMDGAGEFKIYWKIIMPLARPAWLTLVILQFQNLWGNTGGTYIYEEKLKPLSYALSQIVNAGVARTGVAAAVTLLMLVVPLSVFIISQSNVIETMATSGIKE